MDPEASTSQSHISETEKERESSNRMEDAKKHGNSKECEGQTGNNEGGEDVVVKKDSTSNTNQSKVEEGAEKGECRGDDVKFKRKDSDQIEDDMQEPTTSESPKIKPLKQKLPRLKKLSIEEIQKPFDSSKASKRRRSSIPDFSQEESTGTNPSLFVWHKKPFKDESEDEYLTSDPIESEIEELENESPSDMVVSESTIMFLHSEEAPSTSRESDGELSPEVFHETEFHLSEPEDLVDDAFEEPSEPSEPAYDIIVEEVDIRTGEAIDTPRSSDSGNDLLLSPESGILPTDVYSFEENKIKPTPKTSNASRSEPLEIILEESKKDDENKEQKIQGISEPSLPKNLADKEVIETFAEESSEKPPRPPSRKKSSKNLDEKGISAVAVESKEAAQITEDLASTSKALTEENVQVESRRSPSPPVLTSPPLPQKIPAAKQSKQELAVDVTSEQCLPRICQTLTIWPQQFRPLPGLLVSDNSRVSIQIKLDEEEILQTIAVGGSPSRIFSEKATIEIKRPYQYVKFLFVEHMENSETRQIGKLNLRKKDILPINGKDVVRPVQGSPSIRSTVSTVLGEICLNMESKEANVVSLSILDYTASIPTPPRRLSTSSTSSTSSLSSPPPFFQTRVHLAICVTAYGELVGTMSKITLFDRRSIDPVEFNCKKYSEKCSSISAKHTSTDSANGSTYSNNEKESSHVRLNIKIYSEPSYDENSYVGFVRIPLDPETFMPIEKGSGANWYEIKSRMTISQNTTVVQQTSASSSSNNLTTSQYDSLDNMPSTSTSTLTSTTTTTTTTINHNNNGNATEKVGDLRIRFWYSVEHILALNHYQPLYDALISSLDSKPYDTSLTSILQHLPADLGHIARPLMKIFLKLDLFNDFFRLVCTQYVSTSNETSTLFRNQSMASKLMHEMMKFVGNEYLISTLKPVIDLVYAEKKRCEIDPTKLRQGENLEENTRNFAVYAELAFVRVCESSSQCPPLLKSVFNVLREVVNVRYPNKPDIARLAVSSFIIMRFFAAAILNPTQYGLKRKAPEPDVSRTLVLISKILQRLANCVVTQQPLITKEPWLSSVLERFFDDGHRHEMVEFFDSISMKNYQSSTSSDSLNSRKPEILKSGLMVEKRGGSSRRRSIKDLISQKRRFVTLTQKELSWQKEKKDSQGEVEQKGVIPLSEITSVTQINDAKSSFRVATPHQEVNFQAVNNVDMTDWMILLITHQRRHLFFHNRTSGKAKNPHNIDIEKELETLHSILFENIETIIGWKESLETFNLESEVSAGDKFPNVIFQKIKNIDERRKLKELLLKTITNVLAAVQQIESVHQTALTLALQMQNLQSLKSEKLGINGLSDNENYLLLRGRKTKDLHAISPT